MVNAVMDAIALLSSLATDLDIMLNDLRATPSTRLRRPSVSHQTQLLTSASSTSSSPLTVGGNAVAAATAAAVANSNENEVVNFCGYRRRAVYSNYNAQQKHQQQHHQQQNFTSTPTTTTTTTTTTKSTTTAAAATTTKAITTVNKTKTREISKRTPNTNAAGVGAATTAKSKQQQPKSITAATTTQQVTISGQHNLRFCQQSQKNQQNSSQQRQLHRNQRPPDAQKLRARNATHTTNESVINGNSSKILTNRHSTSVSTKSNSSQVTTKSYGLSPEVKQIQKLPLYSYQQRQLEQPQKLHVQRLQQRQPQRQRATHSVVISPAQGDNAKPAAATSARTPLYNGKKSTNAKPLCKSTPQNDYSVCTEEALNWLGLTADLFGLGNDEDLKRSADHNATHQTSNAKVTMTAQNQLKTTSNATATAPTAKSNNSSNGNNHSRLPFCGLDSIKGSDKNGNGNGVGGGSGDALCGKGGNTNLSFDLNLQSEKLNGGMSSSSGAKSAGHGGLSTATGDLTSEQFHSLDAPDSSIDGHFEDDMQALLPKSQRLSRDELSQSRTSLVSSSDGGILAEGETSSETSRGTDDSPPCDLGLLERLLLTHPVWFLPGIQRSGAVHFLQGKEEGNFIVRGSSQPNTMAVSVRLPPDTGPYIEHYLIQSNDSILSLESSRFKFDSIPSLIAHYAQCCDELPVQLLLPRALREAKNRQQLSSLALLGQEFWRYPMACPKPIEPETNALLDPKSPNSLTETSGIGTTVFSSNAVAAPQANKVFSPTNNLRDHGLFSQAGTPSDTTSSMSSFTTSGGQHMQLMSPESVDSVILTMSPVDVNNQRNGIVGFPSNTSTDIASLSTFKSVNGHAATSFKPINKPQQENSTRPQRPKPPNTLNLDLRKPPAPPLRWSKPISPHSPNSDLAANNFTVTTTVTFSMDQNQNSTPQFVEVTTPAANNAILTPALNTNTSTFQTFAKRLSPEGECKDTLSSQGSSSAGSRWQSQSSKDSNNSQRKILSPNSLAGTPIAANHGGKSRRSRARKESKHYQESDILESPQIYCQSHLIDKISDYEDLWSHDPSERAGLLSSFKPPPQPPDAVQVRRPDLLAETPTITSLNANLLSPANSTYDALSSQLGQKDADNETPTNATPTNAETSAQDTKELIQFSSDSQPRSRAALLLPGLMTQSLSESQLKCATNENGDVNECEDSTPTQTPATRSKQGSPFYAEPADALRQAGLNTASILRRSQRGALLPANHRHSEPPKGGVARTPLCPLLMPAEIEKIAGSLDELKKKQQQQQKTQPQQPQQQPSKRARGRFEQWQLDSSWEFMGNQDNDEDGDYDGEPIWQQDRQASQDKENVLKQNDQNPLLPTQKQKPITIHQIIAKRLPDLNLPELVRCSTPPQQSQQTHQNVGAKSNEFHQSGLSHTQKYTDTCSRLSSYDNVERNFSFCQSYFNGIDSAQSDDGTVFSEPWDSSQWDSIMPHDDATVNSDTIHLSKCRPVVSEDDTIIEELSTKDNSQDTLKAKKTNGRQKVATILRNPSIRDREVLSHPRNKINPYSSNVGGSGDTIRAYTLQLAQDQCSTFARNIENFISCTKESREAAPQVVMRNMRQFMNGMKNYLVKHGEGKFQQEVELARARLKSDEFLNLDAILETVMHQLVVLPLREHLYGMFVDYYTRSEDIQLLAQNVKYACGRSASDFGIRSSVTPPSTTSLTVISNLLLRLQEAELPLDKLDLFLCVISTIFDATGCPRGQQLGADDFLPILVYVVAKCGFVGAEIEAEFMWGLLQPTLLNGEPGYYLTALCSAVHVLKSFMASENENGSASLDWRSSSLPACSSVIRVIIPDECNGSLQTRTLPVRPHTTTREVCRIIAHKARITNPQDYALFKLVDGEETLLSDVECPQDIRLAAKGRHCMLAYKRIDAKIAWPTAAQPVHNSK